MKLAASTGLAFSTVSRVGAQQTMHTRSIPVSGEQVPVIGLGTSDEFNTMPADGGAELKRVIDMLIDHGGSLIDTSPAYGNAKTVAGQLLADMANHDSIFISTKIRIRGVDEANESLERSHRLLSKDVLDVVFIHDLIDAELQLPNLRERRAEGRIRYIGISTCEIAHFEEVERLINSEEMDFVQINYGVADTLAAERIIPAAADRGLAVIANSPFADGGYFGRLQGHALPDWAAEFDCESWAQFSLKYALGNPAVTCVIPATSNSRHMTDNASAGFGRLPDPAMRQRMASYMRDL